MSRIANILIRARDTLSDPNGDRWSTDRLLRLIDDAQKDICRRAKLLRTKTTLPIQNNTHTYKLPDDTLLLDRVLLDGSLIPLKSHRDLDRFTHDWENDEGTITCVIFDKQRRGIIRLYPTPINLDTDTYTFNNTYGLITSIDGFTIDNNYGILVDIQSDDIDETNFVPDTEGIATDLTDSIKVIVYYIKKPNTISTIDDELEIDDSFDLAIKYYIVGKALRDDLDTQNRIVGNEELEFYNRELIEAISDDIMDFTRENRHNQTHYRSAFNY